MTATPETLLLHTVAATHWVDADEVRDAVEAAIPEVDLTVARTPPESEERIESAEIVMAASLPAPLLERADALRWVQALSAGVDFYDLEALRERGVLLTSAAGIHAEAIAEQVLGYLLVFERGIHHGMRQQRDRVWERYEGGELAGKTLGVVGVGAIGSRVAEYGDAFGMTVLGVKRDLETASEAVDEVFPPAELFTVLERSDYVVLACPLTDETAGLVGAEELGAMKSSAVLVNIARGPIVDQDALTTALQQHVIRGAGLDVYDREPLPADSPLWNLSNVVMTPHMAGSTPAKPGRIAEIFAANYRAFLGGDDEAFVNRVV